MKKLLTAALALLLLGGCTFPTETIVIEIFTVIEEVEKSNDVRISPAGGIIPVTPKWQEGDPILRGKLINVSEDTLYNKRMRFTITEVGNPFKIISSTIGYMTLDQTKFEYHIEYPYKIEHDLIPGVEYNIYVVGDRLDLHFSYKWWFTLEDDE